MPVRVFNKVFDLLAWLRYIDFPDATSDCEDAMAAPANKLDKYVERIRQPANSSFKAVRIFDFCHLPLLSKALADYMIPIPGLAAASGE